MKMSKESKNRPFAIDDVVYILGRYIVDDNAPLLLIEAKIMYIQHNQFVAYGINAHHGKWYFSNSHYNKTVFKDKKKAEEEFYRRRREG